MHSCAFVLPWHLVQPWIMQVLDSAHLTLVCSSLAVLKSPCLGSLRASSCSNTTKHG